jgi:hypothetical protein
MPRTIQAICANPRNNQWQWFESFEKLLKTETKIQFNKYNIMFAFLLLLEVATKFGSIIRIQKAIDDCFQTTHDGTA